MSKGNACRLKPKTFFSFCTEHLFVRYLGTTINNKEFLRPLMTKKRSSFLQMHAISR